MMVVFTCQHCNESLKRVAVQKHYFKCRNTPYLTCVDCLKDFHGDDYNNHMTCVTEDERYGDKNFVAKKMGVKQTEWIDIVHSCAQKNQNPKFKFIFSKLSTYSNVPRKKPKFLNFIKSSLPKFSQDIATDVFQVIDEEFVKQKKKDTQNENNKGESVQTKEITEKNEETKKKKKKRNQNSESEAIPAEDIDIDAPAEEKSSKKKKKSKKEDEPSEVESADAEGLVNDQVRKKKDKHKNGFLNETSENAEENENVSTDNQNGIESHGETNENDNLGKLSKKELKKLKKKQKYEAELKNIEESESANKMEIENEANDQESVKPSKKQKKRKATTSESETGSGKRQKVEGNETSENCTIENEVVEEEEKIQKGKARFNWEEIIKEVLRKNPDHEMSLKRISKKVLAEYQAVKGDRESYEELISKFNKKINKTVGVRVLKDKAKLISED